MQEFKTAAYYTLGCKLNFSETSTIARQLKDAGVGRVDFHECPDIFVINTCSVTDNADRKCREIVRKALRINPQAFVAIIGCYAQLKPEEIALIPGVDVVLGANEKFDIANYLGSMEKKQHGEVHTSNILKTREFVPSYSMGDRTRTFLKVQDGCNYFCAFCTIPLARGRSRSASIEKTIIEAKKAINEGAKEIVLTGVNIGDFGRETGESFLELSKSLNQLDGINRIRISSIEPNLLDEDIIELVSHSNSFVPHFHIPLQSGSDKVLKGMRRRYLTALYQSRVNKIKAVMPDACIGVDVIVGFPGEGEEEFNETYAFLHALDIAYLHVFTYSERPNTTALRIDEVVPLELRHERSKKLRILSAKKKRAFYQSQLGKTGKVLFESQEHEGHLHGFTENYIKVAVPYKEDLVNEVRTVSLHELRNDGVMLGTIITN